MNVLFGSTVRHRRAAIRNENGEVTVETVIAFPLVLLTIFAIVQLSFNWYAREALIAGAQDALSIEQANSTQRRAWEDPAAVAMATVQQNAGFITNVTQRTESLPDGRVTVTVSGRVPAAFPGATITLKAHVTGTLDNFRPQGEPT